MTEYDQRRPAEVIETVQGEVVDFEPVDVVDEDAADTELAPIEGEIDETDSDDVMVLDSWQIQIPATGDAKVDSALARLTEVEGMPPSQHADVYEDVHTGLQDALADLDRG